MFAGKWILEELDVTRRYFAVLMIVGMLVVAAVLLKDTPARAYVASNADFNSRQNYFSYHGIN